MRKSNKEQVRDGFLGDLPDDLQTKIMNIHKLIKNAVDDLMDNPNYEDLKQSSWAMSCIDEFCVMPKDKNATGSVRVYKKGKTYRCMIQATGHFRNHQYGWIEELLHDFICNVYSTVRPEIRKKYDMTITNEGRTGEPFEGFDIYPNPKIVPELWDKFEDRKTKTITEYYDDPIDELFDELRFIENTGVEFNEMSFIEEIYLQEMNQYLVSDKNDMMVLVEGDKLNSVIAVAKNIAAKTKDIAARTIDWIIKCVKYLKNSVNRLWSVSRAQQIQRKIDKTMAKNGWVIQFDDIPGDIYKDDFFESIFIESNNTDLVKKFGSEVIKNKKLIIRTICRFIPTLNAAQISVEVTKTILALTPILIDLIATMKEISLLQKKYEGKMKKFKNPDGTIRMEIPASEYIVFDKYRMFVDRIIEILVNDRRDELSIKMASTEDLINFSKMLGSIDAGADERFYSAMDNINDEFRKAYDVIGDEYCNSLISTSERKQRIDAIEQKRQKAKESYNNSRNLLAEMMEMITNTANLLSGVIRIYDKRAGVTYIFNGEELVNVMALPTQKLFNTCMNIGNDLNDLQSKGQLSLSTANTIIDKMAPHINATVGMVNDVVNNIQRPDPKQSMSSRLQSKYFKKESFLESTITPEYNVDMSELEAKRTLRALSQNIINDTANKKDYKVTQYTANIYANIITKNLLPMWAKGFRKFSITLDNYQSFPTFEFKVPTMTQDFVSRFVAGRESIDGFLHRQSEIKIKMSPRIFHTMKNPDDAFTFFKSSIRYYDGALERYSEKLMIEVMKLNREMKHLISTTKMSGIVTYPMNLLFVFDNVNMNNKETFRISLEDIKTINNFIRNIYTKYAAPDKEKKQVVDDLREIVKALHESCDRSDVNISQLSYLPEAVATYYSGGFEKQIQESNDQFVYENLDHEWTYNQKNHDLVVLQESFGVKKLKKIPTDLVAYISIEAEAIKDVNDKMMISSYCLSKIEIVEWYIELLDTGSKKYIVPHSKPYLEGVRTQLLGCFKKIMDTPIPKKDRPLFDIKYPTGYEG